MAVTSPYTIAGLREYARTKSTPEYLDTADFLEVIRRMIAVMNVRQTDQDTRWHDPWRAALRRDQEEPHKLDQQALSNLDFLLQMGDVFKELADKGPAKGNRSKKTKIPTPTANALYITCNTLVVSAKELCTMQAPGVDYICLGKANSDPTEHSFGKRRNMCGSNYWTSVQSFFTSNR